MSAPPLPDIFGNYTLGDFVEVVSPGAISWLPQTAAWAWLAAILFALAIRYCWHRLRRWHHNRYRREAIARLNAFPASGFSVVELNKLLKLTALSAFSREQVAHLSGEEWVEFLNRHCPSPPFSPELGNIISTGVYRTTQVSEETRQQLLMAGLSWISDHENPLYV